VADTSNRSWDADLEKDSYVIFMANDSKGNFEDNDGEITISIYSLE
jgi:hypothetical protein